MSWDSFSHRLYFFSVLRETVYHDLDGKVNGSRAHDYRLQENSGLPRKQSALNVCSSGITSSSRSMIGDALSVLFV